MKKGDIFVALIALVLVFVWLFVPQEGSTAVIYVDGEIYKKMPLDVNASVVVESEYGRNTVVIKDGRVSIADADCPGKDCEKEKISETARSIVCLPNRLCVTIENSKTDDETDVIV